MLGIVPCAMPCHMLCCVCCMPCAVCCAMCCAAWVTAHNSGYIAAAVGWTPPSSFQIFDQAACDLVLQGSDTIDANASKFCMGHGLLLRSFHGKKAELAFPGLSRMLKNRWHIVFCFGDQEELWKTGLKDTRYICLSGVRKARSADIPTDPTALTISCLAHCAVSLDTHDFDAHAL